ncbi:uncharacterized protein DNG_02228 [Cephalotrichum gorgonifer]|uniref:Uncharacterized protein n=1 Tax=Cephalotrichum gorgonifer TaxID=2041049 RepID=A0AAE8MTD5_9PEZI|nr:uncharacterized protein DNG_02228 [Cephalotrichum gorgonifer]
MASKRHVIDETIDYVVDDPVNGTRLPNRSSSPQQYLVCEHRDAPPASGVPQPPRLKRDQCRMHTWFWVIIMAAIATWPFLHNPEAVPSPHLASFYNSGSQADRRELAYRAYQDAARKRGLRIKRTQMVQMAFMLVHVQLHDTYCEGRESSFDRLMAVLGDRSTNKMTTVLGFSILVGANVLSLIWTILSPKLRPLFRFFTRFLGNHSRSMKNPDAMKLFVREVVYLSVIPVVALLQHWIYTGTPETEGGWRFAAPSLIFSLYITAGSSDDFAGDEVELFHLSCDGDVGFCSNCDGIDQDFADRCADFVYKYFDRDSEMGTALTPPQPAMVMSPVCRLG